MNGRGICLALLSLPGVQSHLTSCAWDESGHKLATCVATGHLITWKLHVEEEEALRPACQAVFVGGHKLGQPLFGAAYCGKNDDLLLSWGSDGRLCLWESNCEGEIESPISILVDDPDYPIYAVSLGTHCVAVAGGGNDGGFLGIPVKLHDLKEEEANYNKKSKVGDATGSSE